MRPHRIRKNSWEDFTKGRTQLYRTWV